MQTRHTGTLTLRTGRRTLDGLIIESTATVHNDSEIYSHDFVSEGTIEGNGTIWAHISSKPVGGTIDPFQIIIFYPVDKSFVLPIVIGAYVSITNPNTTLGALT
jgi:hypothetical protein